MVRSEVRNGEEPAGGGTPTAIGGGDGNVEWQDASMAGRRKLPRIRINFWQATMTSAVSGPFQSEDGIKRRSAGITELASTAQRIQSQCTFAVSRTRMITKLRDKLCEGLGKLAGFHLGTGEMGLQ